MARMIEFQGKTIATEEWITGNLIFENNLYNQYELQYSNCAYIERKLDSDTFVKCLVIPQTIGQFTNVIGSDKKKIYDHDIVSNGKLRGEVYWNYCCNGWRIATEDENHNLYDTKLDNTYKVVGHKYDELIASKTTYQIGEI